MRIEQVQKMVSDLVSQKLTPQTILLTPDDAKSLGLPDWTRQFMGMKVVIAQNIPETKVVPHIYETVHMKRATEESDRNLIEYQKEKQHANGNS